MVHLVVSYLILEVLFVDVVVVVVVDFWVLTFELAYCPLQAYV
jgi:hypothetical protein